MFCPIPSGPEKIEDLSVQSCLRYQVLLTMKPLPEFYFGYHLALVVGVGEMAIGSLEGKKLRILKQKGWYMTISCSLLSLLTFNTYSPTLTLSRWICFQFYWIHGGNDRRRSTRFHIASIQWPAPVPLYFVFPLATAEEVSAFLVRTTFSIVHQNLFSHSHGYFPSNTPLLHHWFSLLVELLYCWFFIIPIKTLLSTSFRC